MRLCKKSMVHKWLQIALSGLLPPTCVLCGAHGDSREFFSAGLCAGCRRDVPEKTMSCPQCARVVSTQDICGRCRKKPPAQDALWAAFDYRFPLDAVLKAYKYQQRMPQGRVLRDLFLDAVVQAVAENRLTAPDLLAPVPLHPSKLRCRGFNQSLELARPVARTLDTALRPRLLIRTRATESQASLPRESRAKNVRAAFQCREPVDGKHVVVIDDVVTTGNTVNEIAKELRKAGATRIEIWTLSRKEEG